MGRGEEDGVWVEGTTVCLKETEKALLVRGDGLPEEEMWIPKSCVHADSSVFAEGDEGALVLAEWFAKKQGFV
jgi:hypothetical protein